MRADAIQPTVDHYWRALRQSMTLPRLARLAVPPSVLASAALIGVVLASERLESQLAVGAAAGGLAAILWLRRADRMSMGVLLIALAAGTLNFFTLPTGTESRIVMSLLLALALTAYWLADGLLARRLRLAPSALNAPVLAWAAVSVVAFAWSSILRDPLVATYGAFGVVQTAAMLVNILLPGLIVVMMNIVDDERWLRRLVWIVVALGFMAVISELLGLPLSHLYSNGTRGIFSMWACTLMLALALYGKGRSAVFRLLLFGGAFAWFYLQFIERGYWLSGWLPLLVAAGALILLRSRRLFLLFVLVALAFVAYNAGDIYASVVQSNIDEGSTNRLDIWRVALGYVMHHPLFGMGPAGYALYYMAYQPTEALSTHNNFFDILGQTGIAGLLIFAWLMAAVVRVARRTLRRARPHDEFATVLAAAVLAGSAGALTGMMLGDWVLPFAYNQTITGFDNAVFTWLLFGAAGTLDLLQRRAALTPESPL